MNVEYVTLFFIFLFSFLILCKPNKNIIKINYHNIDYFVMNDEKANRKVEILNELNRRTSLLMDYFKENNYFDNDNIKKLYDNYKPNNLAENVDNDYTAYSIDKKKIKICMLNDNGELINDINTSMFVLIHELAHIMTTETGHTPNFWNNMKTLLIHSIDLDIYKYIDYTIDPVNYCGSYINHSPYIIKK